MKIRVRRVYSLNAKTWQPETNYMVQKRVWGRWQDVRQYVYEAEAQNKAECMRNFE